MTLLFFATLKPLGVLLGVATFGWVSRSTVVVEPPVFDAVQAHEHAQPHRAPDFVEGDVEEEIPVEEAADAVEAEAPVEEAADDQADAVAE